MNYYIIIGSVIVLILLCIFLFYCISSYKTRQLKIDKEIENKNQELQLEQEHLTTCIATLQQCYDELYESTKNLEIEKSTIENNIIYANNQLTTITKNLTELQQSYDDNKKIIENNFDEQLEQVAKNYQQAEERYKKEYLAAIQENSVFLEEQIQSYQDQISQLENDLNNYQSKVDATVEASKRELEKQQDVNFYKLNLTELDIQEIKKLREILPYFRNAEPINKVIYKVYYEKPYTDLIGRVIGQKAITGIYKITNLNNGMCYIGQAVNIADRWKQHIKRGVGAEAPTQNKLYPVMYALGPESFTFEVVEECDRPQLSEREQYWQGVYHAKDFGYSIK